MTTILRRALPSIVMLLLGLLFGFRTGRVALGLCDFSTELCRASAGSTANWLLFAASIVLVVASLARLGLLWAQVRGLWQEATAELAMENGDEEAKAAARRLASISGGRNDGANAGPPVAPAQPPPSPPPPPPPAEPAEAKDAIEWLATQPATARDYVAAHWNWDYDLTILKWLVEQPDCDGGVAAGVFWLSGAAEDYIPFGKHPPVEPEDVLVFEMERSIAQRFEDGDVAMRFAFDDDFAVMLKARVVDAFATGVIDWNPAFVTTESSGKPLTIDDVPADARSATLSFLREFGVR